MINKRQFFRHTFKCPECKELTTRTSKYEVVNLAFPYVTCGHCLVIMPSTCAIDSNLATEESGDYEILCTSIFMAMYLHKNTDEILCLNDVAQGSINAFRALQKELKKYDT